MQEYRCGISAMPMPAASTTGTLSYRDALDWSARVYPSC